MKRNQANTYSLQKSLNFDFMNNLKHELKICTQYVKMNKRHKNIKKQIENLKKIRSLEQIECFYEKISFLKKEGKNKDHTSIIKKNK